MPRLEPAALKVESFTPVETVEFVATGPASPSHVPMCTCQSCTAGFPQCETEIPEYCRVIALPTADGV